MTQELVPWIKQNLATTGHEQTWLIGFSKSGLAGQDLILKHPDLFTLAASWDFPADMSSYDQYGSAAVAYGTDANFQANYRLTHSFVDAHKGAVREQQPYLDRRIPRLPGRRFDYDALLTSEGISTQPKRRSRCRTGGTAAGFPSLWPRCTRTVLNLH